MRIGKGGAMAQAVPQTYENHVRYIPAYHGVAFGILAINLFWSLYRVVTRFSADSAIALLLAIAFLLIFGYARQFALTGQDRIIRLEMTLRLQRLLPDDLRARMSEFTLDQLIALRFASDEELPGLCRTVLDQKLTNRKAIKKMVKTWTPDYLRV
jgi:hypothetical protein